MEAPRAKVAASKNVASVDSLSIFVTDHRLARVREVNELTAATAPVVALRRSARLLNNKRAAVLRLRGTRAKRTERPEVLTSVKSLYPPEDEKNVGSCSGGIRRRKSARLIEKRAASLLRPAPVESRQADANPKRKRKHIDRLYKDTSSVGLKSALESKAECHDTSPHALQQLTEFGEEDLLQSILEKLPIATLLQAARVCQSWARLSEPALKVECQRNGWSLPRMPRGAARSFPWRSLYFRHTCRACGKVGEFFVRKTLTSNFQFLLCGTCIRLPNIRKQLVQYSIDLYGVTGKLLVPSINMSRNAT